MIVAIDFDQVMNNMLDIWVDILNQRYGFDVDVKQMSDWGIDTAFPTLTAKELYAPLYEDDLWIRTRPRPYAPVTVEKLMKEDIQIVVVTATEYRSAASKFDNCLFRWFPFLTSDDIIITSHKELIHADVLIDDYPENLRNFCGLRILFDAPYNRISDSNAYDIRVKNWKALYEVLKEYSKIIKEGNSNES